MMKRFLLAVFALIASAAQAPAQEVDLFNGRDLTGWRVTGRGGAEFRVSDGCIVGQSPMQKAAGHTFLVTKSEFDNFVLSFEFQAEDDINSGVQFRSQLGADGRVTGYQLEIDTIGKSPTGAIYDEGRRNIFLDDLQTNSAALSAMKRNEWNHVRLQCLGNSIETFLNGVPAAKVVDGVSPRGVIALQIHARNPAGTEVRWRNIRLQSIKSGASLAALPAAAGSTDPSSTAPALPPIQTDPNQPRIEVIREQGPNAVEWTLAPLDEPVPPNIRQNLMYLREDLLDEAKAAPKAPVAAYTQASGYCDKILQALDIREQARVQAGYRAAQANADMRVSNSQLDARRNYQMSWPQYYREESQRAALRDQETNRADLKKEKVKVEWAERVRQMRPVFDDLYRDFREAMR